MYTTCMLASFRHLQPLAIEVARPVVMWAVEVASNTLLTCTKWEKKLVVSAKKPGGDGMLARKETGRKRR